MLFVALVFQLLSFSIHSIHGYPQSYYGRSLGPWSGGGTGYGNIFKNDNINVGLGGQGGTIVTKEYKPDGMVVQSNQWNKGMNGNVGFMKQVGGSEGIYGQSGPTYIMGQKQGMGWLGGGLGAGGNTFGGTTLVTQQGGDGSYIYSKQKNIGMNGYTGLGATGGGKGSYVFGCPYAGGCGSGGVRAYKGVGLNGGLNANKGYTVIKTVGDNGSYQKQTMSTWGLGGNLGSSVGMGVDGGWKANYRPVGRSMGRAAYYDEPVEVVEDVIQPVQPSPPRQHPYLRTLEGMYSREMDPQASIIMIDDPVGKLVKQ